jgi:hypothetical protein
MEPDPQTPDFIWDQTTFDGLQSAEQGKFLSSGPLSSICRRASASRLSSIRPQPHGRYCLKITYGITCFPPSEFHSTSRTG